MYYLQIRETNKHYNMAFIAMILVIEKYTHNNASTGLGGGGDVHL